MANMLFLVRRWVSEDSYSASQLQRAFLYWRTAYSLRNRIL
ncbi:hypothetical protein [Archangium lansingense]|uniref:Uncharacterized protein n=1 Tax=Archangium lansingense TaxID=2995310 RepID=A0ABT4AMD2_9BACT|nr:hypothetical protein [Archangium lansinium]MCY1082862.1 hypothetical protein [Archangium lansinium]